MHDDDNPTASAAKDSWVEIAGQCREQLRRRVPDMAAMTPAELREFMVCLRDANWFEVNAATHDEHVESEIRRLLIGS